MKRTAVVAVLLCALFGQQSSSTTPSPTPATNTTSPSVTESTTNNNNATPSVTESTTNSNNATPSVTESTTNSNNATPSVTESTTNNNNATPSVSGSSTTNNNPTPSVSGSTTTNNNPTPSVSGSTTTNNNPTPSVSGSTTTNNNPTPSVSGSTTTNNIPTPPPNSGSDSGSGSGSGTDSESGSGSGGGGDPNVVVQKTGPSGTVTSPNYPNLYPNSQDYQYLITVTSSKVIRLTFSAFNVENNWDFVYVYDGNATDSVFQLVRHTGDDVPPPVTSTKSTMLVRFTSDYSVGRSGFQATYTAISKVYANCTVGQYRCGDGVTCIESWKRCNGETDCSDASDEGSCNCEGIPPYFTLCRVLSYPNAGLPNPFNHGTIQDVQNAPQISDLTALINTQCHPEINQLVCALLLPNCNQTLGRHKLPCRSWCEEVRKSCSGQSTLQYLPSCGIFPNSSCYNIPPSRKGEDECYRGNGVNYRGDDNTSPSGKNCERWDLDTHKALLDRYEWANLDENFCRNPDGWERPWCYVEGGFEECDIVPCDVVGCTDPGKPTFGQRSPLLKFYKDGDRITFTCDRGYKFKVDSPPNRAQCIVNGTTAKWSSSLPYCEVDQKWKLTKDVFSTEVYNKAFAPSKGKNIKVHAYIENTISLDEKNEQIINAVKMALEWKDERLEWQANEYGGLSFIYVSDKTIWTPGLTLKRNFDTDYTGGFPSTDVRVSSSGEAHATLEFLASTTCDLDPFLFPQDNMTCPVCLKGGPETVIACAENVTDSNETEFLTCSKTSASITTGEWGGRVTLSATGNTACLTITIQRDPSYHYATTISPCIILVVLMIITFIMPIDKGDRIGFGVTVLLSMVVSLVVVTGFLPVKGTLPFIAMLIIVAMGMMGGFMLVTLCIIIIHDRKGTLPPWARKFFLRHVARMLFMGDLTRKLPPTEENGGPPNDEVLCNWSAANKVQPDGSNGNDVVTRPPSRVQQVEVKSNMPGMQGTLDELKTSVRQLSASIEALANSSGGGEDEVTEYNLLAYVLDRICLFLYIAGIIVAIPCTLYLGK
ncbi:uncharacterized protein LOC118426343 isoform X2 [Branchiostoma floridae]|uniref:Uncharacterized protein LOC118426343 isoform X2 n=1 Tax=Branchiostoma floridae TaxID=7739 RepID=A0A9J7M049_BRAFL|nr:uncharacterized protein LOC118426343 isoform X2 [Branchiostoma floridae]